jgi:hypothetical protein
MVAFAIATSVLLTGCEDESPWKARSFSEHASRGSSGEVPVPSALWKYIIDPETPLLQKDVEKSVDDTAVETEMVPLTVYLIEETPGVLGGRNQKIVFGLGGGELDLRDFIRERRGAFRVVFEFGREDLDPKTVKRVWYLSNAITRKVANEEVGAGCDVFMDISSFAAESYKKNGMLVAIGGDRHISALAGTYFFSLKNRGRVEVAHLVVFDSSKRELLCAREAKSQ